MQIDKAVMAALKDGYSVHLYLEKQNDEETHFKYELKKGDHGWGRGLKIFDYGNPDCVIFSNPSDFLADSIIQTLKMLKEKA